MPKLTIFDLDNTLLAGDSDREWGKYLVESNIVPSTYLDESEKFYDNYHEGSLDIVSFLQFCLKPLKNNKMSTLLELREDFINIKIKPIMLESAIKTIEYEKTHGPVIIATATNSFVTKPIAELFGIEDLIATEFEIKDAKFTGDVLGMPCFREGKLEKVKNWSLKNKYDISKATFYSDSFNDLPLLQGVGEAIVVDGDSKLIEEAKNNDWKTISFRS